MFLTIIIIVLLIISVLLAVRSLFKEQEKLEKVKEVEDELAREKVIFHASSLSESTE